MDTTPNSVISLMANPTREGEIDTQYVFLFQNNNLYAPLVKNYLRHRKKFLSLKDLLPEKIAHIAYTRFESIEECVEACRIGSATYGMNVQVRQLPAIPAIYRIRFEVRDPVQFSKFPFLDRIFDDINTPEFRLYMAVFVTSRWGSNFSILPI